MVYKALLQTSLTIGIENISKEKLTNIVRLPCKTTFLYKIAHLYTGIIEEVIM